MTLCKLIKKVLDESYTEVPETGRDEAVKKELEQLSSRYANLKSSDFKPVDYSKPASRFAYVFKYTIAHADYIRQIISGCDELKALFDREHVMMACLGGGPGSDFLGVLKYMIKGGKKADLTAYLFDKEHSWADSWTDVARHLKTDFNIYPNFAHLDASDSETWKGYHKFLKADLFTLSYFMSEVWKYRKEVEPFFDHCFANAKEGALFLYIDNHDSDFNGWFDALCKKHGIEILVSQQAEMVFSNEEEKTDLGEYFKKFDWPKRKGKVGVRVGIKRKAK